MEPLFRALLQLLGLAVGLSLGLLVLPAKSAEWKGCEKLASDVGRMVVAATGDFDMMQYIHDKAFSHCLLLDEPPVRVAMDSPKVDAPTPKSTFKMSAWEATCRQRYKTFNPDDGTVIRYLNKGRVPCPVPK